MANDSIPDSRIPVNSDSPDWRDINRQIATRLGWHPEKRNDGYAWVCGDRVWTAPERYYHDPEQVWRYLVIQTDLFDYTEDVNTLLPLLRQWHESETIDLLDNSLDALGMEGVFDLLLKGNYLALCKAWLVWWDARHNEGGK